MKPLNVIYGFFLFALLGTVLAGCPASEETKAVQPPTPAVQRQKIESNTDLSPAQKQQYLEQVKQREMATTNNPYAGVKATKPQPGQPAIVPKFQ